MQIADEQLPKSRRQIREEKAAPKSDDYFPPPREEHLLKRKREEAEQDPKLKEFLEIYQPPSKTNIWTDGVCGKNTSCYGALPTPDIPISACRNCSQNFIPDSIAKIYIREQSSSG